jgi:hypothetical protein
MDQQSDYNLRSAFYQSPVLDQAIKMNDIKGKTYYLVRNTIIAKSVSYSFDRDVSANIDVTAVPANVGNIEAKAGFDDKSGTKYSKTFAQPQEVCIQAEQLIVPPPRKVAGGLKVAPATHKWNPGPGDAPLFKALSQ